MMTEDVATRAAVLVVDDEQDLLVSCKKILSKGGYRVDTCNDGQQARNMLDSGRVYDLVLTDMRMPVVDGIDLLRYVKKLDPEATVIMITGYASVQSAVQAIKEGAFDYIPKPFSADQLLLIVERALRQKELLKENIALKMQLQETVGEKRLITASRPMQEVLELVGKVARTDANVLISGESGTGKELVARRIHRFSARAENTFVPLDCAALPENLLESELFGYEKGAFTGAFARKTGLLEQAHQGTVFFDEITEIPVNLQAKLLRALQERSFRHIGGEKLIEVNVRIISATNRSAEEEMNAGKLRSDLYYRLNVITIKLPPLRERIDDIVPIAEHYLSLYSRINRKSVTTISPAAMDHLMRYQWPGNVRELQNVIERAVSLSSSDTVLPRDLPEALLWAGGGAVTAPETVVGTFARSKQSHIENFEKEYLQKLLGRHHGNVSRAADEAGISRRTIHRLILKYDLDPGSFRGD
jgi:DNA-binding NtrC family response regulator